MTHRREYWANIVIKLSKSHFLAVDQKNTRRKAADSGGACGNVHILEQLAGDIYDNNAGSLSCRNGNRTFAHNLDFGNGFGIGHDILYTGILGKRIDFGIELIPSSGRAIVGNCFVGHIEFAPYIHVVDVMIVIVVEDGVDFLTVEFAFFHRRRRGSTADKGCETGASFPDESVQLSYRGGKIDYCLCMVFIEAEVANPFQFVGKRKVLKLVTVSERPMADLLYARHNDGLEFLASVECIVADCGDGLGKSYRSEVDAIAECTLIDADYGELAIRARNN